MKWNYSVSTLTIWTSFDYGEVEANSEAEALVKAKAEVSYNLQKCNEVLASSENTKGFTVEIDLSQLTISVGK